MATVASPLSVDQFFELPDPESGFYELHEGEPVVVAVPSVFHNEIQHRVAKVLGERLAGHGRIRIEFPYAPTGWNYRRADIAMVRHDRWLGNDLDQAFPGAPDLVVEVMSPSNTAARLRALEKLCLENGAKEFWVVYPDLASVDVYLPDGGRRTYDRGASIPLDAFGCADPVPVDEIC